MGWNISMGCICYCSKVRWCPFLSPRKGCFMCTFLQESIFPPNCRLSPTACHTYSEGYDTCTLSYHLGYLETILVHPMRRQSFAGKSDSTFYNIWNLVIWNTSVFFISVILGRVSSKIILYLGLYYIGIWIVCANTANLQRSSYCRTHRRKTVTKLHYGPHFLTWISSAAKL